MEDFLAVRKISVLIKAGIFLLFMMLACAIFAKSVPLLPFALVNFFILQYVRWKYKTSSGDEITIIGKKLRVFLGSFMFLGLSSLVIICVFRGVHRWKADFQ